MQQHPVPQDITGFKFRLIGDMTVKQFAFLAAGFILAFVFYTLNIWPFLKWPLILLSIGFGASAAFVPVQERPLDVWVLNFIKSIYRPTQFSWKKKGGNLTYFKTKSTPAIAQSTVSSEARPRGKTEIAQFLKTLPHSQETRAQKIEKMFFTSFPVSAPKTPSPASIFSPHPSSSQTPPPLQPIVKTSPPVIAKNEKQENLKKQTIDLEKELEKLKKEMTAIKAKEKKPQTAKSQQKISPLASPLKSKPLPKSLHISQVSSHPPNVIAGTVFDQQEKILPEAIVIIKNFQNNPVRALKTNKLGQFMAVTPLENGDYSLETEKEGYKFDIIKISLTGKPLAPVIIKSK